MKACGCSEYRSLSFIPKSQLFLTLSLSRRCFLIRFPPFPFTQKKLDMVSRKTPVEIELKQLSNLKTDEIIRDDLNKFPTVATNDSTDLSTPPSTPPPELADDTTQEKKDLSFFTKYKSWLMWWNSEEWWSSWIGLIFFGCITSAVKHDIPSPEFLPWENNPFHTFGATGNYGLIVIFFAMGLMLWLSMAAIKAPNWRKFPMGYLCVFTIALISKMLASNGNIF